MMTEKLKGKTILITGGAIRIGRAICLASAREGANIIIHYSNSAEEAEKTKKEVQGFGVRCWTVQHDFNEIGTLQAFIENIWKLHPFDILVNNAAIFEPLTVETTNLLDWNKHLSINLTAPFIISQAFSALLPKLNQGRILNLLDWRALRPGKDHFPYTISKAGLAALTKSLAIAFAPRITVNGLALGAILPPITGGNSNEIISSVPAERWAEVREVQEAAIFLLSGPEYITGEIIHIDGGRHLI